MGQRPSNGELSAVETSPLVRLARSRLLAAGQEQWIVQADEIWCLLRPPAHVGRLQGWKLHLSCTSDSAFDVLDAALAVLLPAGCQFKFASTPARVRELTGGRYTRSGAGKFVTVYPDDDEQFRRLARELHEATDGLAGPTILSDRPYCPGSLVHYRYGAFRGLRTLSNDGEYLAVITAPDGQLVEDRRDAWFNPPEWAELPFAEATTPQSDADGVLLANRFVVRQAVRHANKGGVFHAVDRFTGQKVIVNRRGRTSAVMRTCAPRCATSPACSTGSARPTSHRTASPRSSRAVICSWFRSTSTGRRCVPGTSNKLPATSRACHG
jgi:hypothetical protein